MPPAPLPSSEEARLATLRSYDVLDTGPEEGFDGILSLGTGLTGCPVALVSLVDTDRAWFKARIGLEAESFDRDIFFCPWAILEPGQALAVPDAAADPRFHDSPVVLGPPGLRAYLGVPLVSPEGHALGTLCVADHAPRHFEEGTAAALATLARTVEAALELRRTTQQARTVAMIDPQTGLPNRPAYMQVLARALFRQRRDRRPLTVLRLALEGLDRVAELLGQGEAERVMAEVAAALRPVLREEDALARLGPDEFGAILVGGDGREAQGVAQRVRRTVAERMKAGGWPVVAMVGAVCLRVPPRDEADALAAADALMHAARMDRRRGVMFREYHGPNAPLTLPAA
jgi:diguanylate cyclase (GGDEF)-like protein